jgi:hypothetical protein
VALASRDVILYMCVMATLTDALIGAHGMAGAGAFRPTGLVLVVSRGGCIYKHMGTHVNPWVPSLVDVIATDWGWGLLENIAKQFAAAAAADQEPRR